MNESDSQAVRLPGRARLVRRVQAQREFPFVVARQLGSRSSKRVVWGVRSVKTGASERHTACRGIRQRSGCPDLDIGCRKRPSPTPW